MSIVKSLKLIAHFSIIISFVIFFEEIKRMHESFVNSMLYHKLSFLPTGLYSFFIQAYFAYPLFLILFLELIFSTIYSERKDQVSKKVNKINKKKYTYLMSKSIL